MRSSLRSKSASHITSLSVLYFLLTFFVQAAPGDLDTTFGSGGKVKTNTGSWDYAHAMAIQSDGKIVVAGYGLLPLTDTCLVVRYNPDGSLDTGFSNGGIAYIPAFQGVVEELAIQSDGKIVIVGRGWETGSFVPKFAVGRLNLDGSLDTSFDGDGVVKTQIGTGPAYPFAVGIQTDGKIVVGGSCYSGTDSDLTAVRYNPDGSLDTSFDGDGIVINTLAGYNDRAYALKIQPDGKILLGGQRYLSNFESDFELIRYKSDGTLDNGFGVNGIVTTSIGAAGLDELQALVLQTDGKIIAGGGSLAANRLVFTAVRYHSDGTLDLGFDQDGVVTTAVGNTSVQVRDMSIQPNGKTVLTGWSFNGQSDDFTTVRYDSDGSPDESFGAGGLVMTSLGNGHDQANAVAVQPDGKIVLAGLSHNGVDYDYGLVRYLGDPVAPRPTIFDFDGDSKTDIGIFRPAGAASEWWINRSSDSQTVAVQFGASTDHIAPADYTGDRKTDVAFFRSATGEWYVLRSEDFSFFALPFGTGGDIPVPADFDADGKADYAVFRPSSSTWYITQSTGAPTRIEQFGTTGDVPVVADYDGDGKADVGIFRPSMTGAEWWIIRSTAGLLATQFGASTDKAVQGDYTGDGKADVAVWRPSDGNWLILRSEDFSFYGFPFGTSGDVVSPGDYDGDGTFDAAVFRPSNATWFIERSSAGTQIIQFGATGDRPIPNAFVP